jgi:type II secretory pathway pseudopilin PulG
MHATVLSNRHRTIRGSILVTTIVFMGIFSVLFASLLSYLLMQHRWVADKTAGERSFQIAEAGVEYYRWHLAHWPDDLQDGTGAAGPYVHTYDDPETGPIGQFSLEIGGDILCGKVQVVQATSTGWTFDDPGNVRTIVVRIARPTVADYSYIVDSNVYAGNTRTIIGPYHSNGVVRMDADNHSVVTSKVGTTSCSGAGLGGCSGTINGVYGSGTHPEWWRWAQPDIPFSNFDFDFDEMEAIATAQGIHLSKVSDDSSVWGYYLKLRSDKSVDIYKVTSIWKKVKSKSPSNDVLELPELAGTISNYLTFVRNQPIPQACPLIYVSDRTWLEGVVSGKVTVVANDTGAAAPDLFLQNNVTYSTTSGADGLTVLAERNLLIPLYVPDNMTVSGVFFAQKGAYGRDWYENDGNCSTCTSVNPYDAYKEQHSLTTNGTVVSKLRTGTQWGTVQGFDNRYDNYDRTLAKSPPPLTPFTSPDFRFIEWREIQ